LVEFEAVIMDIELHGYIQIKNVWGICYGC